MSQRYSKRFNCFMAFDGTYMVKDRDCVDYDESIVRYGIEVAACAQAIADKLNERGE